VRAHAPTPEFPQHLEALYARFPFDRSLGQDPLELVRPHAGTARGAEVAGIFASTLAVGNTTAIRGAFRELVDRADGDLVGLVGRMRRPGADRSLEGFRHRWIRGDQLGHLAYRLNRIYAGGGTLESVFLRGLEGPLGFAGGLDALARALRGDPGPAPGAGHSPPAPPGYTRLFPTPLEASRSPCKRLVLFVRWMVRTEYPDLGLWTRVPVSELRIPLDQHVFWIAYHLGLTQRRTRSWAAVEEVTGALRAVDPSDPMKFDFVLCHTGVSGDCPKRRDLRVCGPCVVRPDCRLWHGRGGG
jgi:uncharacterized protein (TIGR02757 family)